MTVSEMCSWYLEEARAGNILGRKNVPIKTSSLDLDESRIRTHIGPLIGNRIVKHLTIAIVEQMQTDVKNGKTAKPRTGGRGGKATGVLILLVHVAFWFGRRWFPASTPAKD